MILEICRLIFLEKNCTPLILKNIGVLFFWEILDASSVQVMKTCDRNVTL